jgi:type II secretory pathway component HofQ
MWKLALWFWSTTNHAQALIPAEVPMGEPILELPTVGTLLQPKLRDTAPANNIVEKVADSLHTPAGEPSNIDSKICSISVASWDVAQVLRELSVQSKANLILLTPTDTKLTLNLARVRLIDMIKHICAMSGLGYIKMAETYVLATPEKLQAAYPKEWFALNPKIEPKVEPTIVQEQIIETYMVNYVDGKQIAEALGKFFPDIIVVAGPAQVSPTVSSKDTAASTGIATGVLDKEKIESGKMLIFRGTREKVDAAITMAKTMDYKRPQVAIYVAIHDISNEAVKELGLSWNYSNLSITESGVSGVNFGSFTRAPLSFVAAIKALEKQDRSKLLASPNISVLDGERAFILIGNRLNFPVLIGYSQANTPIFDKQEERVGIYLQVAAAVGSDNNITLSLYPQVSSVTGFLEVNGASYPQIATREAQTTLRVVSGETIVMGGMLKDEELSTIEKVPLLSEIPFFGELFKRRKRTKVSSQVMITITPVLLPANK